MRRRDFGTWFAILLFPAVFIPAGTAGLIIGGGQTIDAIRSPDWPRATGKIVYVARKSQSVDVRVVYDYPVGGQYYRSMRHSFGSSYARPSHSYKVGDSVAVFYDPADPQSAVLDPGLEAGPVLFALFSAVGIVVGFAIGRFLYRASGRN